jgi:release factor glutamine methyltransferase
MAGARAGAGAPLRPAQPSLSAPARGTRLRRIDPACAGDGTECALYPWRQRSRCPAPAARPMFDPETPASFDHLRRTGAATLSGEDAARESELLLAAASGRSPAWLRAHGEEPVPLDVRRRVAEHLTRRQAGEPIAYILGEREFWSMSLSVGSAVLIPRPETERLVELGLERIPMDRACRVADLGTGSGAIALAIARERAKAQVVATDASAAALAVARGNAARLGLTARVAFELGDWYGALARQAPFDVLLSNPPYIAANDRHLRLGDLRFEPVKALASGRDGLEALRILAEGARDHLVVGGWLLVEHGFDQGAAVRELFLRAGLTDIATSLDLAAQERVTLGSRGYRP